MRPNITARHDEIVSRVHAGLSLARSLGARMAALYSIEKREAIGYGNIGLLQAAQSFRPQSGIAFRAWAAIRIRGAILDGLRSAATGRCHPAFCDGRGDANTRARRRSRHLAGMATARELGLVSTSLDARDVRAPSPEQALLDAEEQLKLRRAVARLTPVERSIIEEHYFCGQTLADAARVLGKSKSRGSRLHAQALRRLRRELARADGESSARPWRVAC